jgi:hypothetical protein
MLGVVTVLLVDGIYSLLLIFTLADALQSGQ